MPEIDSNDFESRIEEVDPSELTPTIQSFAPYLKRQGLYIHSFQCMACSLEFALFSWWPDRHTVVNTYCPECGRVTQKSHWRADVVTDPGQRFGEGPEVYNYSPVGPDPQLMMDSSFFTGLPDEPGEGTWPDLSLDPSSTSGVDRPEERDDRDLSGMTDP